MISFILIGGYFSFEQNTGKLYETYQDLWEFRILNPEVLPDTNLIRLSSAWHTNSYADTLWIQLIQYIWDNIFNDEYHTFLNPIIEKITTLHPHFTETYNLALLLSPTVNKDKENYLERKKITETALRIGEEGIMKNCNIDQLNRIYALDFSNTLWDDASLKNPCSDPMLAYNVAITANELEEYSKARQYFKIASVEEKWPQAARFLGPLMDAKRWDHRSTGERFLLLAIGWYDETPFSCQKSAWETLIQYKTESLSGLIESLEATEKTLSKPKDMSSPIATSGNTCHGFFVRAIKQFYLAYISEISKDYPEITTGSGLLEKGLIKKIPTIEEQIGWSIIKKDDQWRYTE
jgi:hypothetical protein